MNEKLHKYSLEKLAEMIKSKSKYKNFAFTEIYSRLSENVYIFIVKMTSDEDEARDVFQETFISFHNYAQKNTISNVTNFLYKVARNAFLNNLRIKEKTRPLNEEFDYNENEQIQYEGLSDYDSELYRKIFNEAVDTLDFKYKEPFVMRHYIDLEYDKMSLLTDLDINTLKTRVFRAKQLIKKYIENNYKELID